MKSLWITIAIYIALMVGLLITFIVVLIKKPKQRILIAIFCLVGIVVVISVSIPFYKDVSNVETTSFIGTYLKDQSSSGSGKGQIYVFMVSSKQQSIYAGAYNNTYSNYFEKGKKYKIEYFIHTRIISSVEEIE